MQQIVLKRDMRITSLEIYIAGDTGDPDDVGVGAAAGSSSSSTSVLPSPGCYGTFGSVASRLRAGRTCTLEKLSALPPGTTTPTFAGLPDLSGSDEQGVRLVIEVDGTLVASADEVISLLQQHGTISIGTLSFPTAEAVTAALQSSSSIAINDLVSCRRSEHGERSGGYLQYSAGYQAGKLATVFSAGLLRTAGKHSSRQKVCPSFVD
jgi:hypothetical protein